MPPLWQPQIITRTVRNDQVRLNGERFAISGGGLTVEGRPPVGATIALDDQNGGRMALQAGMTVPIPFSSLWLFNPVADAGTFRLVFWPRGTPIGYAPEAALPATLPYVYSLGVNAFPPTPPTILDAPGSTAVIITLRVPPAAPGQLVRVLGVALRATTAATYDLTLIPPAETGHIGSGGIASYFQPLDGRFSSTPFPALATQELRPTGTRGSVQLAQGDNAAILESDVGVSLIPGQSCSILANASVVGAVYNVSLYVATELLT